MCLIYEFPLKANLIYNIYLLRNTKLTLFSLVKFLQKKKKIHLKSYNLNGFKCFLFKWRNLFEIKTWKFIFFFNVLEVWDADQLFWFFRLPFLLWWFHSQRFVRCNLLSSVRTEASENERYRYNNQVENDKLIQKFEYLKNSLHANLNPDYWWNIFEFISVFCSKSFNFSSRIQTRFIFQDCMAVKLWKNFLGLVSVDVHEFTRKWWYFFSDFWTNGKGPL